MTADGRPAGLILGSASPRRANLLRQINAAFDIVTADADETADIGLTPAQYVSELSERKARAVYNKVKNDLLFINKYERAAIVGADTTVVAPGGEILGKPDGAGDAKRMLGLLSGNWHEVYTGVTLLDIRRPPGCEAVAAGGRAGFRLIGSITGHEATRVKMCVLDAAAIARYVESGEPAGKAGAYAIQGMGALFVERVEGCFFNVVGLPLRRLDTMLRKLGYDHLI